LGWPKLTSVRRTK